MKTKRVWALLLVVSLLFSLSACAGAPVSPPPSQSGSSSDASSQKPPASTDGEKMNIVMMNMFTREHTFTPYFEKVIEDYLADYPNVEFEYEALNGTEEYNTKFNTYIAANDLPEIFLTRDDFTPDLVRQNKLRALDDILDDEWKSKFIPMWSEQTVDGSIYGLPYQFITNQAVYYNSEILAAVGYTDFPKTWEDWMEMNETLKNAGYIPMALGNVEGWPLWSHIGEPLTQFVCGNEWVANGAKFDGSVSYNDPDFVKTMTMVNDLKVKGYFNSDVVATTIADARAYYINEQAATLLSGSWTTGGLKRDAPDEIYAVTKVAPLPRPANAKPEVEYGMYTGGSGYAYALNPRVDADGKLEMCTGLLKAMLSSEAALGMLKAGTMPSWKIDNIDDVESAEVAPLVQMFLTSVAQAPEIYRMNRQQNGPAMTEVIYKKTQEMLTGSITPEQCCADIQAVYEEYSATIKK